APGGLTIQTLGLQLSTTGNTGIIFSTAGDINIISTGALALSGNGRIQALGYAVNLTAGAGALTLTGTSGGTGGSVNVTGNLNLYANSATGGISIGTSYLLKSGGNIGLNTPSLANAGT